MNEKKVIDILKGQIMDLPQKQSKKVNIFLSSTFSGTFIDPLFKIIFLE